MTIISATRNAREALQLTLSSFRRYTDEACVVLIADNGSVDGALEDLLRIPWIHVIPLETRRRLMIDRNPEMRARLDLKARLEVFAATLLPRERLLLRSLESDALAPLTLDETALTDHGVALDWLAERVETPFFLTLDSDVEFLGKEWLSEMLEMMLAGDLAALGEYEPGIGANYMPRLAPYLLLLRTADFRRLGVSFRGLTIVRNADAMLRLDTQLVDLSHLSLSPSELTDHEDALFYSTGARLFERLQESDMRWAPLPASIKRKFLHLEHMSWAGDVAPRDLVSDSTKAHYLRRLEYVRERLQQYRPGGSEAAADAMTQRKENSDARQSQEAGS